MRREEVQNIQIADAVTNVWASCVHRNIQAPQLPYFGLLFWITLVPVRLCGVSNGRSGLGGFSASLCRNTCATGRRA